MTSPNRATRRSDARRGRKLAALGSGAALATTGAAATVALTATPAGAATFTVDNLDDSGAGSLRDAINLANASAGPHTITFAIGGDQSLSEQDALTAAILDDAQAPAGIAVAPAGAAGLAPETLMADPRRETKLFEEGRADALHHAGLRRLR